MNYFIPVALPGAAIIHLIPAVGVLGADRLAWLYGVGISDPNVLLRHHALLFALIGLFLCLPAFRPEYRWPALLIGLVSTFSTVAQALAMESRSQQVSKIVIADVLAGALILVAAVLQLFR